MTEVLFWIAAFGAVYSYLLYPALLWLVARRTDSRESESGPPADVTVVIAARNEAERIVAKLDDTCAPGNGAVAEVIVLSDASTDATDELVRSYPDPRVRLVRMEERLGKEAAQGRGIREARHPLLVFTDVATRIAPGSLERLAQLLVRPGIGAVSSVDRFVSASGAPTGEGLYVRYEMALRSLESRAAGLVGLSGSFFGVRRELCDEWRTDVPSDLTVALTCARRGFRAVSDDAVVGIYPDLRDSGDEFARKRRTVVRGMAGLAAAREVLDPRRFGLFSFQVWSHKVMRWAVPWFLGLLALATLALVGEGGIYALAFLAQVAGYGAALAGWMLPGTRANAFVRFAFYFCQVNLAMARALVDFAFGRRVVTWEPSKR